MAYNGNLPSDNDYIAAAPAEIRENFRALKDDKIVNAQKLQDLSPGNANGNIPVSNGNLNTNLNAEKLGGSLASAFATAGHTHAAATSSSNGMMSNTDKAKLDTVASGAEVNQNAFSNILVGTTTIQADGKTDTLEMVAGTNIALTPDATNDRLTVAVTGTVASAAACTGNAATTSKLATPRNIALTGGVTGSVAFDGSADASLVTTIAGNAPTATKLATARTINGVAFDGSTNITVTAAANGGNATTVGGYAPGNAANNILKLDTNAKVPVSNIPVATTTTVGGVKVGSGISVDTNGVISSNMMNTTITVTGGTQKDRVMPAESVTDPENVIGAGNIVRYNVHEAPVITAGTYALQDLLQRLITAAHNHTVTRIMSNCDCNCSDCSSN